ncbi:hypothetical protein QBC38DRAFT_377190 [Podospora fimiseda]|uniref:Uncharacterized protein n=1 Tax=Podospora fimiseda TaxID=252190 RepID=A0AAN6YRF9_9PEZI|nr:hypothetical protein QBC38DRAFT_377190 [Podospora fimiseda]
MSSALVEINNKTQIQPYEYQVVIEEHDQDKPRPRPGPSFLDWVIFQEVTLPPRENPKKSRLDRILSPLNSIKAELPGNISVEGLGGIVESAHNVFHSVQRLDFMQAERTLHLHPPEGVSDISKLSRRELERFENELFDLTKYNGFSEYLTAVTWTEEGHTGSITLFKVLFNKQDDTIGIKPVAAMQNVPNPVLVKMRTHEKIQRKLVFVPRDEEAEAFKWKANPSRGPTYVKLGDQNRPLSPMRSSSRSHSRHGRLEDADGVRATIPQFVALMHGNRALLEDTKSTSVSFTRTANGEKLPTVKLVKPPRQSAHEGDSVHVAVLIPDEASWADEEIIWTDDDGLVEFRQRRYWDLIEPAPRPRVRTGGRSKSRGRDKSGARSRSRSRSSHDSRSRSRHHSLNPFS